MSAIGVDLMIVLINLPPHFSDGSEYLSTEIIDSVPGIVKGNIRGSDLLQSGDTIIRSADSVALRAGIRNKRYIMLQNLLKILK